MIPVHNYFKCMQMGYPRWPPRAVKHENDNILETLGLNRSNFVPDCFLHLAISIFFRLAFQYSRHLPLQKSRAKHENSNFPVTAQLILTKFMWKKKRFLHWIVPTLNKNRPVKMASITKNKKMWNWEYLSGIVPTFVTMILAWTILIFFFFFFLQFGVPRWPPSAVPKDRTW